MVENLPQLLKDTTKYWQFHHPDAPCHSPSTAVPWLLCIVALTVSWSFLLGAQDIRRRIRSTLNPFPISSRRRPVSKAISVLGSLVLQLAMTLATAQMLLRSPGLVSERPKFGTAMGAWILRPMPAIVVSVTSLMSPSTYFKNAMELQAVELLYGLGSGYFIFDIFTTVKRTEITIKGTRQSSAPIATATIVPTAWVATSTPSTRPNNAPKGSLEVSQDRTCGSSKQQTCLGSFWGDCCSRFGYCGRDNDYCTEGCQPAFGTCKNAVKQRRNTTTTDGSCGTGSGIDASCLGSRWGSCCSAFSFCGNNETYCGVGCQKQYGICLGSPVQIAGSLSEAEQSALTFLNKMQTGAIIGTVVWVLVLLLVAASYSHYRGFAAMATAVPTLKACCVVLSLGRFIAGLMLWDAALRLDGEGFCVAEKTMVGITVIWAFVPLADHCWRAML